MEGKPINKKFKTLKILLAIFIALILLILIIKLIPFMKNISTTQGRETFRDEINSMGILGFLLLFSLQVAQILLVVFPGEPFEILAGMCYGSIGGMLFIFLSVFLSTLLIYFLVKKYKEKYLYNFFKKEKIQKILNSNWYKSPKKTETILIILFLIPGVPKDILVFVGPLLNINPWKFILIATFARFPSVISSTMVGSNLISGNWQTIFLVYSITALITGFFVFILYKFDKDKDAINSIK